MTLLPNYNQVFTDYLSVTYSPNDYPSDQITVFLCTLGFELDDFTLPGLTKFFFPTNPMRGYISLKFTKRWALLSCSGKALSYLRMESAFGEFLSIVSTSPHTVTRIDAAMDVPRDFVGIHQSLRRSYPDGSVKLGRKALRVMEIMSHRALDSKRSGAYYIGHRRNKVYAIIYDKSLELLDKFQIESPTTTRYELTFKSAYGISLKDAYEPKLLFWQHGEALLLKKPSGISTWVAGGGFIGWSESYPERLPYERLVSSLDRSTALKSWLVLADNMGPNGRKTLVNIITKIITS